MPDELPFGIERLEQDEVSSSFGEVFEIVEQKTLEGVNVRVGGTLRQLPIDPPVVLPPGRYRMPQFEVLNAAARLFKPEDRAKVFYEVAIDACDLGATYGPKFRS